jgi:hypothetical protein
LSAPVRSSVGNRRCHRHRAAADGPQTRVGLTLGEPVDRKKQESDQLPEEAPPEQVVEDVPPGCASQATSNPGGPGPREERGTGYPDEARDRD